MRHRFWLRTGEDGSAWARAAMRWRPGPVGAGRAPSDPGRVQGAAPIARGPSPAAAPRATEDELYLDGSRVYLAHYRPAAPSTSFAILVPPLFEEGARTRKVLVNLARELAQRGVHAVRFDYPGTGLSAAPHEELTLTRAWDALERALTWCQGHGAREVRLIGLRFGGYLALSALSRLPVDQVIAWEPVLDPAAYFQETLRVEMSNQMVTFGKVRRNREELVADLRADRSVLVDGNRVSPALFRELEAAAAIDVAALMPLRERLVLMVWESKKLHEAATQRGLTSVQVPDVHFSWKHIRSLEPRSAALFAATLSAVAP